MTRLKMPPTPASSTEIKGQDHSHQISTLQMSFELPPSAIGANAKPQPPSSASKTSPVSPSTKTIYPVQPSETVKSRRRSSAAQKETFALPPPPTRSRRIIQMKPRPQDEPAEQAAPDKAASSTAAKNASSGVGSKKKQPSATSAAGRKIARKTAHSLIERRRRSKMNEEFAVLKGLIPACTGEMHKLAILQASIEYVRYLEDCIAKLKEQRDDRSTTPAPSVQFRLPPSNKRDDAYDADDEGREDVEMTNSEAAPSPAYAETPARSNQSSISPALMAQDARGRQQSYSSASTDYRHYSYSAPSNTSPAFGPQGYPQHVGPASASHSALTSPALRPQQEMDQEASAALLMLNIDRRGTTSAGSGRGMSVRDLLSS
ncbi:hypothetical protein K449DRAFT_335195 [Hypoxylon sp. EC38]|nr:hypothetical protein K449DRAFT_335195 [Hypoxylon sp. EC38]